MKCRFDTLFIISISDDFSVLNLNQMTSLLTLWLRQVQGPALNYGDVNIETTSLDEVKGLNTILV